MSDNNIEIGLRLKKIRNELSLNQSDFASRIGIGQAGLSALEKGIRTLTDRNYKLICSEFNINEEWLRSGMGEMFEQNDNEILNTIIKEYHLGEKDKFLLNVFLNTTDSNRDALYDLVIDAAKQYIQNQSKEEISTTYDNIIQYSNFVAESESGYETIAPYNALTKISIVGRVAGGKPIIAIEEYERSINIDTNLKCDCALELVGDSMDPEYPDGSILLIRKNIEIENGDVAVVLIMKDTEIAEATCKRFYKENGHIRLVSINDKYEDRIIQNTNMIIYGKVIGCVNK